jgi:hypothetical protein
LILINATLAQLVERQFCKLDRVSSTLTGGSDTTTPKGVLLYLSHLSMTMGMVMRSESNTGPGYPLTRVGREVVPNPNGATAT